MATFEHAANTARLIQDLMKADTAALFRRASLGELHFGELEDDFKNVVSIFSIGNQNALTKLPDAALGQLHNALARVRDIANRIGRSSVADPSFVSTRSELIEEFRRTVFEVLRDVSWLLTPLVVWNMESEEQKLAVAGLIETTTATAQKMVLQEQQMVEASTKASTQHSAQMQELEKIIDAARKAAGSIGIDSFSNAFGVQATDLKKQADIWLIATAVAALATVFVVLISPYFIWIAGHFGIVMPNDDTLFVAQIVASKVIFTGIGIAATLWCGRMYKALKHQQSINDHRARALETFKVFWRSGEDPAIKDAVLLEATRSIFAITSPGYLARDDDASDGSMKIVEVIKSVARQDRQSS